MNNCPHCNKPISIYLKKSETGSFVQGPIGAFSGPLHVGGEMKTTTGAWGAPGAGTGVAGQMPCEASTNVVAVPFGQSGGHAKWQEPTKSTSTETGADKIKNNGEVND